MSDRELFQGKCLVSTNGYQWMGIYDKMPPQIRARLQSSSYNLCPACVQGAFYDDADCRSPELARWNMAIDIIEQKIRHASA